MLAGISNAIAGGGTFFTFPVFIASGIPPVIANASNAVAVWPGHALAIVEYRRELHRYAPSLRGSICVAFLGGMTGAVLLNLVGNHTFTKLIPLLIFLATLLFGLGPRINAWLATRAVAMDLANPRPLTRLLEFLFSVYGGFFGAGLGVMLMAGLFMLGVRDIQASNALKNLLATVITTVSVVVYAMSSLVFWPHTIVAFVGAVLGGLLGARIARHLSPTLLRRIVIVVGCTLSVYYFRQYYLLGP